MEITRKISSPCIIRLRHIQEHLLKKGLNLSQKDLIDRALKFAIEHKPEFYKEIENSKKKSSDPLKKWHQNPIDIGKSTDSLKEHDTVL